MEKDKVIELLQRLTIFQQFKDDRERLLKIVSFLEEKKFLKGTTVIQEGDIGDSLYIISKGVVRVEKNTLDNDHYTVVILEDKMNIFFGEICLLEDTQRTASIVCEADCDFLILKRKDFIDLCNSDYYFGFVVVKEISKILASRLKKADDDIITLFSALVSEVEGGVEY